MFLKESLYLEITETGRNLTETQLKPSDTRRFHRTQIPFRLIITKTQGQKGLLTYGWVIGRGGLGFMSKVPFQVEANLDLRIYFASDGWFKKSEVLHGKVRWIKPISQSYAMGIEFQQPIGEDQPDLLAYIEAGEYHGRYWRHSPQSLPHRPV